MFHISKFLRYKTDCSKFICIKNSLKSSSHQSKHLKDCWTHWDGMAYSLATGATTHYPKYIPSNHQHYGALEKCCADAEHLSQYSHFTTACNKWMSTSLRDLYLRSSEILHNWQEVVLVFRYDSSFLLCESCKTSQRAMAVTNICQSERVIWPTSNIFFSCPTNQQLRHGFTPGHLSTDARLCKFDLAAFDAASAATKLEFGGTAEEEGEDLIISWSKMTLTVADDCWQRLLRGRG